MPPRALGWRPDTPDHRDYRFTRKTTTLPSAVDLSPGMVKVPVFDQGRLGSCTANAICSALAYEEVRQHLRPTVRSRLFVYYVEREMEGTINSDAGAEIRDGIKAVANTGAPPESNWRYLPGRFTSRPSVTAYKRALRFEALRYERLDSTDLADLKSCLALDQPFVCGFSVYESFDTSQTAATGVIPMPGNEALLGGHAVLCIGYDDASSRFRCRNSWGAGWGMAGDFTIPYAYLTDLDLSDDFWAVQAVGVPVP